jgi:hypothetical protein
MSSFSHCVRIAIRSPASGEQRGNDENAATTILSGPVLDEWSLAAEWSHQARASTSSRPLLHLY